MKKFFVLLCFSVCALITQAQNSNSSAPIIFIYDASGSMWGQMDGLTKMEVAANVLADALDNLPQDQQIGLVAYGHRREKDCEDVEFLIDPKNTSKEQIRQALKGIKPLGRTPLAYSALKVIEQLRNTNNKATIILVTDGIEVCGGNLCEVIRQAKADGIDFKLHVIGFGLKDADTGALKCAAKAGDGEYFDAANASSLGESLDEATTATIDSTAYIKPIGPEKNFGVYAIKNGQAVDAWVVAFEAGTDKEVSTTRTYKDTNYLSLPPGKYDLKFALGNSEVEGIIAYNVESLPEIIGHKTISFDAGKINVTTTKNGEGWDAVVNIYSKSTQKKVGGSRTYGKSNIIELNPGTYDVEVAAMKLKGPDIKYRIENIEVKGNEITEVSHDFKSGTLTALSSNNDEGWDSVAKITSKADGKGVAGGRTYGKPQSYLLNPGIYEITFEAMRLSGPERQSPAKTIEVKVNEETKINHNFTSGILRIGARIEGELIDAIVKVKESNSGKEFGGGRTYATSSSNPREMILSPATYSILITAIKSGKKKEFSVVVKAGEKIEKFADF